MLASTEVLGACSYYIPKIVVPSQPHIFLRDHYQRGRWLRTTNTRACDGHLLQVFDFGLSRLRRCWKAPRLSRVFRVRRGRPLYGERRISHRKRVVSGEGVSIGVVLGGRRHIKK